MRFRSAQDKHGPFRWLFQRLQQGVERFAGNLVSFVNDKDFESIPRRAIADALTQLAHFINATVGCSVNFNDVHRITSSNFTATGAIITRFVGRAFNAIQAAGHDAGNGGFPGATLAGKNIAMGDARGIDGIFKGRPHVFLADEFFKCLGAILAGDNLIHADDFYQTPGDPRHTGITTTVASFRTWRGLQLPIARSPEPETLW